MKWRAYVLLLRSSWIVIEGIGHRHQASGEVMKYYEVNVHSIPHSSDDLLRWIID